MKRLLRSIIDIKRSITLENLVFNFTKLRTAKIRWERPDDEKVYNFICQYFQGQLECPSLASVRDYFQSLDDIEVLERLKDIEASDFYIRTNFSHLLKQEQARQTQLDMAALLKEAHDILVRGLHFKGEDAPRLGPDAAFKHFVQSGRVILDASGRLRETHDIRSEAADFLREYADAEAHPERRFGAFSGIEEIDRACGGAKGGELWVHGAFPGEMKSSFAQTWAYNVCTRYSRNVVYVSLEMPDDQVRRIVYVMHSGNPKWRENYGILDIDSLEYAKVRDGQLSPKERSFLYDYVAADFEKNPHYCRYLVHRPASAKTIPELQTDLEILDTENEIGLVIINQGQWVEAQKQNRRRDNYTVELNSIVHDTKSMAMSFAGGRKVPVILLWQINREGKDEADKNGGEYKLKAFTYANEVEKTADVVTTSYLNEDLRAASRVRFGNLKNRDNQRFRTFDARVDWRSRYIVSVDRYAPSAGIHMESELENV